MLFLHKINSGHLFLQSNNAITDDQKAEEVMQVTKALAQTAALWEKKNGLSTEQIFVKSGGKQELEERKQTYSTNTAACVLNRPNAFFPFITAK